MVEITFHMTTDISMGGGVERWILNILEGLKDSNTAQIIGTNYFDKQRFESVYLNSDNLEIKKIKLLENKLSFFRKSRVLSFLLDNFMIPLIISLLRKKYEKAVKPYKNIVYLTKNQYWKLFRGSMIIGSNHSEFSNDSLLNILKAKLYAAGLIYRGVYAFHVFPGRDRIKQILSTKGEVFEIPNGTRDRGAEIKQGKNNFLYVGRLESAKGVDRLIDAWRLMTAQDCTLTIAGTGSIDVKSLSHGVKNIHVTGAVTDETLDRLYREANYFIYPTRWDSFPMTVIEALSASCYVITTETIKQSFIEGVQKNIVRITGDDPVDIARCLDTICNNATERELDVNKVHQFFMEHYFLGLVNEEFYSTVEKLFSNWYELKTLSNIR